MLPDGFDVLFCPRCRAPGRIHTFAFFSRYGAVVWTDGFREERLTQPPTIATCYSCRLVYWLTQAFDGSVVRDIDFNPTEEQRPLAQCPIVACSSPSEITAALDRAGPLATNAEEELEARRVALMVRNHEWRLQPQVLQPPLDDATVRNLERMLVLLAAKGIDPDARLITGDVLRELQRFGEADEVLGELLFRDPVQVELRDLMVEFSKQRISRVGQIATREIFRPKPKTDSDDDESQCD
jgi:hypothetical protein